MPFVENVGFKQQPFATQFKFNSVGTPSKQEEVVLTAGCLKIYVWLTGMRFSKRNKKSHLAANLRNPGIQDYKQPQLTRNVQNNVKVYSFLQRMVSYYNHRKKRNQLLLVAGLYCEG